MVDAFIPTNDIICFTPQILVNSLDSGNISSLSKFSLLVFDECHHTRGDEPYARLARKYLVEKANGQKELPQVCRMFQNIILIINTAFDRCKCKHVFSIGNITLSKPILLQENTFFKYLISP